MRPNITFRACHYWRSVDSLNAFAGSVLGRSDDRDGLCPQRVDQTDGHMTSLRSSAARGSAVTLASQGIRLLLMMSSTVVLARLLLPSDYGLIAMVLVVVGVADIFRDFGLSMAALRAKELTQAQQSNLFWINSAVGLVLTGLIYVAAEPIASFYDEPRLVSIVHWVSLLYVLGGLSTQFRVSINRELRFTMLAACDLVPIVVGFVVALWMALEGFGLWALVAQQLAVAVASLAMVVVGARWRPGMPSRHAGMAPLMRFGMSFAASQLLSYGTRNVDSIAVGRAYGPHQLGSYDRAYQLMMLPLNQVNAPLTRVAVPVLSRMIDDRERYGSYLRQAQLVACYLTASLFMVVAGVAPQAVQLLMGDGWGLAGEVLRVLAIGGVFRSIEQISYWMYMSQGLATQQLRFYLVAQPLIVVVMLAGLPWGPVGVAAGHSIGYALFWAGSLLWAGHVSDIDVKPLMWDAARAILIFGTPGGLAAFIVVNIVPGPVVVTLAAAGLAALGWYAVAWKIMRPVRRDLDVLMRFGRAALRRG